MEDDKELWPTCPNCGTKFKPGSKFCPECGFNLSNITEDNGEEEMKKEVATEEVPTDNQVIEEVEATQTEVLDQEHTVNQVTEDLQPATPTEKFWTKKNIALAAVSIIALGTSGVLFATAPNEYSAAKVADVEKKIKDTDTQITNYDEDLKAITEGDRSKEKLTAKVDAINSDIKLQREAEGYLNNNIEPYNKELDQLIGNMKDTVDKETDPFKVEERAGEDKMVVIETDVTKALDKMFKDEK